MATRRLSDDVRAYLGTLGSRGGKRAAAKLSPAERTARAQKASRAAALARTAKAKAAIDAALAQVTTLERKRQIHAVALARTKKKQAKG